MVELKELHPHIVIGANYGDEGKGATVNWLAKALTVKGDAPKVIRHNGGTQAAHTVQLEDGTRHVFRIHGSGSFQGSQSIVSSLCLIDSRTAMQEEAALAKTGYKVKPLMIHPEAKIITPLDIFLNQAQEWNRENGRHGSCGNGIGVTMQRNLAGVELPANFVFLPYSGATSKINAVGEWFKKQLNQIIVSPGALRDYTKGHPGMAINIDYFQQGDNWRGLMEGLTNFTTLSWLDEHVPAVSHPLIMQDSHLEDIEGWMTPEPGSRCRSIIFEGAQGLLLDEDDKEHYPHVTWSKTGSINAAKLLASEFGNKPATRRSPWIMEQFHLYYVTRTYLTRHGAGPMLAGTELPGFNPEDLTNVNNEWQGSIRSGRLDICMLMDRIHRDATQFREHMGIATSSIHLNLVVTWADLISPEVATVTDLEEAFMKMAKEHRYKNPQVVVLDGRKG